VVQFGDMRITVLAPDPAEVVAKAEARVALARDKAAKKKQQGATGGKAAAPWTATPAGKAKPRAGAKGGPRTVPRPANQPARRRANAATCSPPMQKRIGSVASPDRPSGAYAATPVMIEDALGLSSAAMRRM
jgi:hypothetical protein